MESSGDPTDVSKDELRDYLTSRPSLGEKTRQTTIPRFCNRVRAELVLCCRVDPRATGGEVAFNHDAE